MNGLRDCSGSQPRTCSKGRWTMGAPACAGATPLCRDGSCARRPSIAAAQSSGTCATLSSGASWCWGSNMSGQLGDGTTMSRAGPVRVKTSRSHIQIGVGASSACALGADGLVECWGSGARRRRPSPRPRRSPANGEDPVLGYRRLRRTWHWLLRQSPDTGHGRPEHHRRRRDSFGLLQHVRARARRHRLLLGTAAPRRWDHRQLGRSRQDVDGCRRTGRHDGRRRLHPPHGRQRRLLVEPERVRRAGGPGTPVRFSRTRAFAAGGPTRPASSVTERGTRARSR